MKKKAETKTKLIKACDILFAKIWKIRIPHCEKCGKKENLQLAHIISRDCAKLRHEPKNKFILCGGCHLFWAHKKPLEFAEFVIEKKGGEVYKWLLRESRTLKPLDIFYWRKLKILLEDEYKKYEKGI